MTFITVGKESWSWVDGIVYVEIALSSGKNTVTTSLNSPKIVGAAKITGTKQENHKNYYKSVFILKVYK